MKQAVSSMQERPAFVSSLIGKQKEPAMQTPLSGKMSIIFRQRSCNKPQAVPLSVLRISS